MENKYICNKCLNEIPLSRVIIKNNKILCPYCKHTIETNKFKVKLIRKLQDTENKEE